MNIVQLTHTDYWFWDYVVLSQWFRTSAFIPNILENESGFLIYFFTILLTLYWKHFKYDFECRSNVMIDSEGTEGGNNIIQGTLGLLILSWWIESFKFYQQRAENGCLADIYGECSLLQHF